MTDLEKFARQRKIFVQYEHNGLMHYVSGREAQALLALVIKNKQGLTHIDFQLNFRGGYRLGAYIHLLRKVLNIETVKHKTGDGIRFATYYLRDKLKIKKVGLA